MFHFLKINLKKNANQKLHVELYFEINLLLELNWNVAVSWPKVVSAPALPFSSWWATSAENFITHLAVLSSS